MEKSPTYSERERIQQRKTVIFFILLFLIFLVWFFGFYFPKIKERIKEEPLILPELKIYTLKLQLLENPLLNKLEIVNQLPPPESQEVGKNNPFLP